MKNLLCSAAALLAFAGMAAAQPLDVGGFIFCDANSNGQIDSGDSPLASVLVVVTNVSGTFSNSTWSDADGGFVLEVPPISDHYVEYLHPLTLAADATVTLPAGGVYTFSLDGVNVTNFTANFLVTSTNCTTTPPPPPPPSTNGCCLAAEGSICSSGGREKVVFGGFVSPACGSTNGDTGVWHVFLKDQKLHLASDLLDIVTCGDIVNTNGSTSSFFEFQGAGTLKGPHSNNGVVYFYARAESYGHCKKSPDRLYLRVYTSDGTVLALVSGDTANPDNIVTVPIKGHVEIGTSCCDHHNGGEGEQGDDDDHGGQHGDHHGDQGKHNGNGHSDKGNSHSGKNSGHGKHGKG